MCWLVKEQIEDRLKPIPKVEYISIEKNYLIQIEKFRNYLLSRRLVTERQLPFHLRWASQFIRFCKSRSESEKIDSLVDPFLITFGKTPKQWPVDQVKKGISLFCFFQTKLEQGVGPNANVVRSKRVRRLPTVLTLLETAQLLDKLSRLRCRRRVCV